MTYNYLRGVAAVLMMLSAIFTAGMALALWCWLFHYDWHAIVASALLLAWFGAIGWIGVLKPRTPEDDAEWEDWAAW